MDKKFETLYYFMNENVSVIETKRTDLGDDAKKEELYQWYFVFNEELSLEKLEFESAFVDQVNGNEINVRKFKNAEFRFDDSFGKFQNKEGGHIIMKVPNAVLPQPLEDLISKNL
ncbi:hypothetical protein DAY19_03215 [Halobacteriovorax vibrionivorans]|uniref:Uncharacterized protein n=1 Tax=Halobacteriovorax vibrionivorans TaxID=2152716 RepID=A0ABY0IIL0_9BACT|nr:MULTISPECIES: hypothetical protein [Halobacteriovorax]RZF22796.1 hypothetical protein DAY19_03215 [Halobacteriovorax vibrionivorans]TGD45987.1 hypothetical protein EP118_13905 [Halobacteriovorax sp. Y22]